MWNNTTLYTGASRHCCAPDSRAILHLGALQIPHWIGLDWMSPKPSKNRVSGGSTNLFASVVDATQLDQPDLLYGTKSPAEKGNDFLKLMSRLRWVGLPVELLQYLENLSSECCTCVKWRDCWSDMFTLQLTLVSDKGRLYLRCYSMFMLMIWPVWVTLIATYLLLCTLMVSFIVAIRYSPAKSV